MDVQQREELEQKIRRRCDARDYPGAAEAAIRGYGREIFEFLAAMHRREDDASEVFSRFTEGLFRGLPNFAWQCTFRTWAYAIARRASLHYRRDARRHAARFSPMPEGSWLSALEAEVRTETLPYLRTERKSRFAVLRESLPPEDQMLLMLRVDRKLAWNELAQVMHEEGGAPLDDEALKREAARLRKRFQLVKERLYEMGRREGLIRPEGDEGG